MATLSITPEVAQFIEEAVARGVAEGLAKLSLNASSEPLKASGKTKEKKPRKPRNPDAKPNKWILFTQRVRAVLVGAGHKLGLEATLFSASLKNKNSDLDSWSDDAILTEFTSFEVPVISREPKKKAAKATDAASEQSDSESKPQKPKKVLSPEHKAALQEGKKKKAAERKAAASGSAEVSPSASPKSAPKAAPAPKASAPAPAPAAAAPASEWKKVTLKGKSYLWNPSNNYTYYREADGSQGDWAGILNSANKTIDTSVPEPLDDGEDFELDE
jgi:chemotaxis protein histidine kinase CheA